MKKKKNAVLVYVLVGRSDDPSISAIKTPYFHDRFLKKKQK